MVSDNEKILNKLKNVGNPMFLLRLINNTNKLLSKNQMSEKAQSPSQLFIEISGKPYRYQDKKLLGTETIDEGSALVKTDQETVDKIAELIESNSTDINKVFKDLRRVKNIERYQEIYAILDQNFKINVTLSDLVKLAF
ncbi:hypothetical protein GNF18_09825 [Ligilactobacillus pobuzihii]|uniref:hypothetical protein n=1 Tax=Ligilactobacillus pobuzihii TaxID=449659 RepID=UPI0019D2E79A|nr:hypothetical protein [Ligilactobacillus pobuzihii]MBN7275438.1 hypothetical protein [Ligilactobacillus pobuzihii]